jgi:hypothetical protein
VSTEEEVAHAVQSVGRAIEKETAELARSGS